MSFSNFLFTFSLTLAAVAVFLTTDVCEPLRENVVQSLPQDAALAVDKMSIRISRTLEEIFGLPQADSMKKINSRIQLPAQSKPHSKSKYKVFTKPELKQFDGSDEGKPVYLGILGRVYDVSRGRRHYGKDGGYSFFAGRDGTRAFITGQFDDEGLIDDIDGLSPNDCLDLKNWMDFYEKDYKFVGLLTGNFYDESGQPTAVLSRFEDSLVEGKLKKQQEADDQTRFPPCNSEWTAASGGRVWCSDKSGGIERDWIGVPRIYKRAGHHSTRCACIRTHGPPSDGSNPKGDRGDLDSPLFKIYEGCHPAQPTCKLQN